jgi:hypothetical protein
METVDTIEYKGYTINIYPDECAENPQQDWDMVGEWVCWHKRYNLSSTKDFKNYSPEEFIEWAKEEKHLVYPLYMYEHGNIAFSLARDSCPFNCPWDPGQAGFVLVRREKAIEYFGKKLLTKYVRERVWKCINSELETMNDYYSGAVYGYRIDSPKNLPDCDDSCRGFYGYEHEKTGLLDHATDAIEYTLEKARQDHLLQAKEYIRNHVPLLKRVFDYAL